jgi:hypothetical protein
MVALRNAMPKKETKVLVRTCISTIPPSEENVEKGRFPEIGKRPCVCSHSATGWHSLTARSPYSFAPLTFARFAFIDVMHDVCPLFNLSSLFNM